MEGIKTCYGNIVEKLKHETSRRQTTAGKAPMKIYYTNKEIDDFLPRGCDKGNKKTVFFKAQPVQGHYT